MINLPKLLNKKKEEREYFLSLIINSRNVGAILFEKLGQSLHVISTKDELLNNSTFEEEDILSASDKVISFVETSLPEGVPLNKTIFAVPYDWVDAGKIKKEYLTKLKSICEALDLTPIGFIISVEAITSFVKKSEGAPVSSIFVEIGGRKIYVYIVKNDNVIEARSGDVEDDLPRSVEKLLKKIENVEVLPSKIVLLDYEQAEEIQQSFLSYQWSKELPFLHIPQTVVLEKGFEKEAIISGVGNQMGYRVEMEIKAGKDVEENAEKLMTSESQEFGFVKDQDIQFAKGEVEEDTVEDEASPVSINEESNLIIPEFDKGENKVEDIRINDVSSVPVAKSVFSRISNITKKISFPKIYLPSVFSTQKKAGLLVVPVVFLILLFLFSFVYYGLILKADISVFTDRKSVNEKSDLVFSSNEVTSGNSIKVSILDEEISGEGDADVTGITETGDKSTGEITVYNKSDQKRTFDKGSVITSSNNLKFILVDNVSVASFSASAITPPSAKVKIEASKFGTEYNLPSGTNFSVGDFSQSDVLAKNDSAFSGGTKKEIKTVSQKDLDTLEAKVFGSLEKQAIEKASSQKATDEELLPESFDYEYVAKNFSKKKGDQSSDLHLSVKINFKVGKYSVSDLEKVIRDDSGGIPSNYNYVSEDSKIKLSNFETQKNGEIKAKLVADAVFVPKIKSDEIAEKLKGKNINDAKEILDNTKGVSSFMIVLKNKLPLFPNKLPTNSKNINLLIRSNE